MVYNVSCSNDTSAPSLQLITVTDVQPDKVICNGRFVFLLAKTLFGGGSSQHIYADHASSVRDSTEGQYHGPREAIGNHSLPLATTRGISKHSWY